MTHCRLLGGMVWCGGLRSEVEWDGVGRYDAVPCGVVQCGVGRSDGVQKAHIEAGYSPATYHLLIPTSYPLQISAPYHLLIQTTYLPQSDLSCLSPC